MLKNKKTWDLIGAILGIVILLAGFIVMCAPAESYSTSLTDYATFGADFYTYQYKATRAVASNAAVAANNLRELSGAQAAYFGLLLMAIGALTVVHYGKKYFTEYIVEVAEEPKEETPEIEAEETPVE